MSRWFYTPDNKQRVGPLTIAQLRQLAINGTLRPDYMVMPEGTGKWMPAAKVTGLFPKPAAAQPAAAQPAAAQPAIAQPQDKAMDRGAAGSAVSKGAKPKAPPVKRSRKGPIIAVAGCLTLLLVSCSSAALFGAFYNGWFTNSGPSLTSVDAAKKSIDSPTVQAPDESQPVKASEEAEIQPEAPKPKQSQPDPPQPKPDPPKQKQPDPPQPKTEPPKQDQPDPPKPKPQPEPKPDQTPPQLTELPAQIAPATVARVKKATVLLHVVDSDGAEASGSGFFALKPGIIVTNAHVLGMLAKQGRPPKKVEVVLHSGEANETKLKGSVLGVDRDNDLGIVRVEGAGLPTPLRLETQRPLVETQKVYVFGFPFGTQLGKNITIAESSISSLRTNGTDRPQQIQINGGIHPGNSGGPLVNTEGNVVGIAVSIIRGTQINFAIPTYFVSDLAIGRVTESWLGEAYAQDGKVSIPVKFSCLDPFDQVKELRVDVWTGMPGQALSGSLVKPKAKAGDGERQTVKLELKKNVGEREVSVPAVPEGQVCWLQPVIITQDDTMHWGPAVATRSPLLPVERKRVKLAANFDKVLERTVKLKSVTTVTFTRGKLTEIATDKIEVEMLEVITPEPDKKNFFIRTSYGPTMVMASEVNGKPVKMHAETDKMFRALTPSFIVTPSGGLKSRVSRNLNPKLPLQLREDFLDCYEQFCSSVEAAMVPIPERELEPLGNYGTNVALLIAGGPSLSGGGGKGDRTEIAKTVDLILNCRYEGTRTRNGREEAVMTFVGKVKGRSKGTERAKGDVTGKYGVDVEGGFVSLVHIRVATEIEAPGGEFRIGVAVEVDADRLSGNPLNIAQPRK